ncbi:transferrin-binding protein-like solute binding protein [Actinobacillus equuli subsp. haemolyticus]|uniref:transferrin-binding protein-like solute binding protein n=1 Tax=Actinobacillus equuli TaxID=718 RepID=UPI0024431267|nr:transferrin-binding protein-like solute binding protein [Actinobacillus equuli]WGE72009.1 transferrin-binding protein-like solute binding protein [Actinobacillus equuli subsp. haemolyticus]
MNKNLRLSLIAIACSLAITACSSDNKGATRYENLVKNKTEEATKRAEEKAKRAQESDTAKKLADLEKKQKELEAELAKKQNGNTAAPSVSGNVPNNVITPSTPAKSKDVEEAKPTEKKEPEVKASVGKVLSTEEAKKALEGAFKDNGIESETIKLSGGTSTLNSNSQSYTASDIIPTDKNLNTLNVDGTTVTLISTGTMKEHRAKSDNSYQYEFNKIFDIKNEQEKVVGKVGSLPKRGISNDFDQMRYGYYTKNGQTILFVQGYMTPTTKYANSPFNYWKESSPNGSTSTTTLNEMPTSKTYEYSGSAFYGNGHSFDELKTRAYADFDNKKVKIELLDNDTTKLTLGANITNNTFSGEHNGTVTKGAFFGNRAQDLGGLFYQTSGKDAGKHGVFGASQDCGWQGCAKPDINLKDFAVSK